MWTASVLALVFAVLALLHLYWALGGQWGVDAVVPRVPASAARGNHLFGSDEKPPMVRAFNPSQGTTLLVAAVLAGVAVLVVLRAGLLGTAVAHPALRWTLVSVAVAMLLRAVGDFRLVGFFKKITGSRFARLDTLVYSPLCMALGLGLSAVAAA